MLDVVFGATQTANPARDQLLHVLESEPLTGTLFFGYPVIRTADSTALCDAMLITREHGLVLFDLTSRNASADVDGWAQEMEAKQDDLYRSITQQLLANKALTLGRRLVVEPLIVSILSEQPNLNQAMPEDYHFATAGNVLDLVRTKPAISENVFVNLNAALQRVTTIRPQNKRTYVQKQSSRGATLKKIEEEIANLDAWQKKAAIESADAPQRIRGLAGSGKTIVLALKAAYLHTSHPDWNIVITFFTRALGQQIRNLIRRFTFEAIQDEPDWSKLRVLHAWGTASQPGVYSEIARRFEQPIYSLDDARSMFGDGDEFGALCRHLLRAVEESREVGEGFIDAMLIDEAQDFPQPFFELAYHATKAPKRIVWAYDELQNLGNYSMAPAEDLFGRDASGVARVHLRNIPNQPQQDVVMPVCYRNTPWALASAHALGFGIYRDAGLVQMFDAPSLWNDIGYEVSTGSLSPNQQVTLRRKPDCSPGYFQELLNPNDAISFHSFDTEYEQADWIADSIKINLDDDELQYQDILIVLPDAWTSRSKSMTIKRALSKRGLTSHLAGVGSSKDVVFVDNSIAMTSIFRAKGNEAPMVYVASADYCYSGLELAKKRNMLFTAMTRSRAWLRVCGVGPMMEGVRQEYNKILTNQYGLKFRYPTPDEIASLRTLYKDRPATEVKDISHDFDALRRLISRVKEGDVNLQEVPEDLRGFLETER